MITIKANTLEKISTQTKDSIYILIDFDKTITSSTSTTSWKILENSKYMPKEYSTERHQLFKQYRPIEIDETVTLEKKKQNLFFKANIIVTWTFN